MFGGLDFSMLVDTILEIGNGGTRRNDDTLGRLITPLVVVANEDLHCRRDVYK